jgi:hypothetical protein
MSNVGEALTNLINANKRDVDGERVPYGCIVNYYIAKRRRVCEGTHYKPGELLDVTWTAR